MAPQLHSPDVLRRRYLSSKAFSTLHLSAGSQPDREAWHFLSTYQIHQGKLRETQTYPSISFWGWSLSPPCSLPEAHTTGGTSHSQHSTGLLRGHFPETRLKILVASLGMICKQIDTVTPQHQICLQECCQELWVLRKEEDR